MWSYKVLFALSGTLRLLLISFGQIQDVLLDVKFTDVDYHVFSDAARLTLRPGGSPYDRRTYRYSPIIAWLLTPNVFAYYDFGKILFNLFDLLNSYLILQLCKFETDPDNCKLLVIFSLFNPFSAVISCRGNAESLISTSVLLILYFLRERRTFSAALVHGLAVHLKLYPIIFLPSVYFCLLPYRKLTVKDIVANFDGYTYVLVAMATFGGLNLIFYAIYGRAFLDESLLYHLSRVDIKHNFSPYFYPMYLTYENYPVLSGLLSGFAFIPQFGCVLLLGAKYRSDLPFCWFLSAYAFVSFNKVCTSQYFVWYLMFVPLILHKLSIDLRRLVRQVALWLGAQSVWLIFAYLLEFRGKNVFVFVWLSSILLLCVNTYLLCTFIRHYNWPYKKAKVKGH